MRDEELLLIVENLLWVLGDIDNDDVLTLPIGYREETINTGICETCECWDDYIIFDLIINGKFETREVDARDFLSDTCIFCQDNDPIRKWPLCDPCLEERLSDDS